MAHAEHCKNATNSSSVCLPSSPFSSSTFLLVTAAFSSQGLTGYIVYPGQDRQALPVLALISNLVDAIPEWKKNLHHVIFSYSILTFLQPQKN